MNLFKRNSKRLFGHLCTEYLHTVEKECRDLSMRTVTRKFANLYLTRKLNDNLKMYQSKR